MPGPIEERRPSNEGAADRRASLRLLLFSLVLQLGLALVFGHTYDTHVFMATGYLVGSGQNPYAPQDLSLVMQDPSFRSLTAIGYLPPWPIVLGALYSVTYAHIPNLLLYNLAIKLPIIAANIGLAYLVAHILRRFQLPGPARNARRFLLLSPALLYFGAAWGQFDAIVAFLSLASLVLLERGRWLPAAALLSLAVAVKPIALPLLPVGLVYLGSRSVRDMLKYGAAFAAAFLLVAVAPFVVLGWNPDSIVHGWNAHFTVGGGMSILSFLEAWRNSYELPGVWWLLGLAWIPALALGIFSLRGGIASFSGLLKSSVGLTLIFFLTRAWLSEPNTILLLPLVLLLALLGEIDPRALAAVAWFPLIFTIFNASPPQLLFPAFPKAMQALMVESDGLRQFRLLAKGLLAIPWQLAGWWIVATCLRRRPPRTSVEMATSMPRLEAGDLEGISG
jgi:hypothetical protein